MPDYFLPPKICPLMSGPSGQGGTSLKDCTSRCALHDHGACALLASLRREPSPPSPPTPPMPDVASLLALAKVLGSMGDRYNEHERYELGMTLKAIADRIREALGEGES